MDEWTHTHDLCNHDNIYTDTYVYQYMIPRRVITIYTWGENSAKSKALTCVRGGNYEQNMNKL